MVRQLTTQRYAFTMIELIFAIIIISIAVISLPTITDATSKGIESNIVQEAIFAGSAELNGATSNYWDNNSMQDIATSSISRVIDTDAGGATGCNNDNLSVRYRLKPGHIAQPLHRRCLDDPNTVVSNNAAGGLDSAEGTDTIFEGFVDMDNNKSAGYKNNYNSTVDVAQDATNDNIKILTVTITNGGTNIVILKTQSANVGEVDYFKRRF